MRKYYADHCQYGFNVSHESGVTCVYAFTTKAERDQVVEEEWQTMNAISAKTAYKLAPELRHKPPTTWDKYGYQTDGAFNAYWWFSVD